LEISRSTVTGIVTELMLKLCAERLICYIMSTLLKQTGPPCQQMQCVAASTTRMRNSNEQNNTSLQGEGQIYQRRLFQQSQHAKMIKMSRSSMQRRKARVLQKGAMGGHACLRRHQQT